MPESLYNLSFKSLKSNNKLLADVYDATQGDNPSLPPLSFDNQQLGEEAKWINSGRNISDAPLSILQKHKNLDIYNSIYSGIKKYNETKSNSIKQLEKDIDIMEKRFDPKIQHNHYPSFVPKNIHTESILNYGKDKILQSNKRPKPQSFDLLSYEDAIKFGRF
jgi:hypothetical protein